MTGESASTRQSCSDRAGDVDGFDVDVLASEFLSSEYASRAYAGWSLDRRLDGFLLRHGLTRIWLDGDSCNRLLDRVMTCLRAVPSTSSDVDQPRETRRTAPAATC